MGGGRVLTGPLPDLRQVIRRLGGDEEPGAGGGAPGGLGGYLKVSPALVTEDRAVIRIFINHTITPSGGRSAPHRETMLQLWLHTDCLRNNSEREKLYLSQQTTTTERRNSTLGCPRAAATATQNNAVHMI